LSKILILSMVNRPNPMKKQLKNCAGTSVKSLWKKDCGERMKRSLPVMQVT